MRVGAPEFDGFQGPLAADRWLRAIKRLFRTFATLVEYHVTFAAHQFTGAAITWWETLNYTYGIEEMTWDVFENLFWEAYFNPHHRRAIADVPHPLNLTMPLLYN